MIIVTRPSPYGEELTQRFNQAGFPAKHLPFFKIDKGENLDDIQNQLNQLNNNDIVIIVSPQVCHMIQSQHTYIEFPEHVNYFAIGQHTATLFEKLSKRQIRYPNDENSEGLINYLNQIKLPIEKHKAIILCGDVSRPFIKETLESEGALVNNIHCYKRIPIHYSNTIFENCPETTNIIITSIEHLQQLEQYCTTAHKHQYHLTVSGNRIMEKAKRLGWQKIHIAIDANNQNLFKTMATLCHNAI